MSIQVSVEVTVRAAPENGVMGTGRALGGPLTLRFAVGDADVPSVLQTCVCSMSKGERAAFWVPGEELGGRRRGAAASLPVVGQDALWLEVDLTLQAIVQVQQSW